MRSARRIGLPTMLEYHVIAVTLTSMSIPTKSPEAQASSDSDLRASLARTGMLRATLTTILRWFQASQNQDKVRHQASLDGWTRCRRPGYSATYRSCWMLDTGGERASTLRPECGKTGPRSIDFTYCGYQQCGFDWTAIYDLPHESVRRAI